MSTVSARFFGSRDARPERASLELSAGRLWLRTARAYRPVPLDSQTLQASGGPAPRVLRFPDGGACEVDGAQLDQMLAGQKRPGPANGHSRLRQCAKILALSVLIIGIVMTASFHLLKPLVADYVAARIPAQWLRSASEQALVTLDREWLGESTLPLARRDAISAHFAALRAPAEGAPPYQLLFRHGGKLGAVTFALPGGEIVISDEMVMLAQEDREILALLAQQLGQLHQHKRLSEAVSESLLPVLKAVYLQDLEQGSAALAINLLSQRDSAASLAAADRYALAMLRANGIESIWLATALQRADFGQALPLDAPGLLTATKDTQARIDAILGQGR